MSCTSESERASISSEVYATDLSAACRGFFKRRSLWSAMNQPPMRVGDARIIEMTLIVGRKPS